MTYAQDQTVQLGMEKTLQNLPDTFSRCGKGQTNIFSFFNSLLLNLFHVFLINRSYEKFELLYILFLAIFSNPFTACHRLKQPKLNVTNMTPVSGCVFTTLSNCVLSFALCVASNDQYFKNFWFLENLKPNHSRLL